MTSFSAQFAAPASFCAYPHPDTIDVRFIKAPLFSFFGVKQRLRIAKDAVTSRANTALRVASISGFVLVAGLVAYNIVSEALGKHRAQQFAASVDAEIDARIAHSKASFVRTNGRSITYIKTHIDGGFDVAAWKPHGAHDVPVVAAEVMPVVPVIKRHAVHAVIDAKYVQTQLHVDAHHSLVVRFKAIEKTCPPVVATMPHDTYCAELMAPLYREFTDAFVAQTTGQTNGRVAAMSVTTARVSAPKTTLLKIHQPKPAVANRPVRSAEIRVVKKKPARPMGQPFDAATFFERMSQG